MDYQKTLLELRELQVRGKHGSGAASGALQRKVQDAYGTLNRQFRSDMNRLIPKSDLGKNRGSALTSAERGIALARRRRHRGLYVAEQAGAIKLTRLSKALKYMGNSLLVLDAGIRVREVNAIRRDGGHWYRAAAMQTTGFGFGGALGLLAGKTAVGTLITVGLAATPAGWVVLIGAGVAAGFTAGNYGDRFGKRAAAFIWDRNG